MNRRQDCGFTFIEVVVVLAILGLMLPVVFSILFTVARQQSKIYRLSEAKQQGDFASLFMKSYIREHGKRIFKEGTFTEEACTDTIYPNNDHVSTTGETFFLTKREQDNAYFQFTRDDTSNRLIFNDNGARQDLTTGIVQVTNFQISCIRKSLSYAPFVIVSFRINYTANLATAAPEDIAVLDYKTVIKMQ